MATPIPKLDHYKLETEFHDDRVVHTTYGWEFSTRLRKKSTWREVRNIGAGAFGSVSLEREDGSGQLRAVKTLSRDSLPKAGVWQELLALVKLREHGHLFVEFLGWYEDEDDVFLAMEYIEHGDLSEYMRNSLDKAKMEVREITRQILEGLEVLHEKGICHRDLKPQNVLIASPDPIWVKIADFGTSKRTRGTALRTMCGTEGYLAPELLGVLPREHRTAESFTYALDMWSLGCLVHEILTARTPFLKLNQYSGLDIDTHSLYRYCRGEISLPTESLQSSGVSEEGIDFVKSLLVANPKDRPTAIGALQNPWLLKGRCESGWYENLRDEFSALGVNLDLENKEKGVLIRKTHKADIMGFLPMGAKERFRTLLQQAVEKGLNSVVLMFLKSPSSKSIDDPTKESLLQRVAKDGRIDTAELLLASEVGINTCNDDWVVSQIVTRSMSLDMMKLFLGTETYISTGPDWNRLLRAAAESGHIDIVKLLLDNGADVNAASSKGRAALQAAAWGGHTDMVQLLLANGANVNAGVNSKGQTALWVAAHRRHIDVVKVLLANGADVNAAAGDWTPLRMAVYHGHTNIVKLLLSNGADANDASSEGRTVLQVAALSGHTDMVQLLLSNGANVDSGASSKNQTALQVAAGQGHIDIVKLLLDNGADVNAASSKGRAALQAAARSGHTDMVQLLLVNGANVNAGASSKGQTALWVAACRKHIDVVKVLLANGADVNAAAGDWTPLWVAVYHGHTNIVKLLLSNGADANAASSQGWTALQVAADSGRINIVKLLLSNGANVNASSEGWAALQVATDSGNINIAKLLLSNGADVGVPGSQGWEALQVAAKNGLINMGELLPSNKADVNAGAGSPFTIPAY